MNMFDLNMSLLTSADLPKNYWFKLHGSILKFNRQAIIHTLKDANKVVWLSGLALLF